MISGKGLCDKKRKDQAGFAVDLGRFSVFADLAPGHGFVWPRARIGAIELGRSVQKHGEVGAVSLQCSRRKE